MPDVISNAQLNILLSCGELYRRKYILREKSLVSIGQIKGLVMHKVGENYFTTMIQTGEILCYDKLIWSLSEELDRFFNLEELHLTREEKNFPRVELRKNTFEVLHQGIPLFLESVKGICPAEAEHRQTLRIPGVDQPVMYVMDLETIHGDIIDFKVTGKKKSQSDIDNDFGLTIYAYAYFKKTGKLPRTIRIFNYILRKTPKKQELKADFLELETHRTIEDFEAMENRLKIAIDAIKSGIFLPAEAGHWKCNPDYCQAYGKCQYVGKKLLEGEL